MAGLRLSSRAAVTIALSWLLAAALSGSGTASPAAHWVLRSHFASRITVAGEGVASYRNGRLVFRGLGQVPATVAALGFNHVGDEDIDRSGAVYDAGLLP